MNEVKRQIGRMLNFSPTMATSVRQFVVIHINFPIVLLFTNQLFFWFSSRAYTIRHSPCRTVAVIIFYFFEQTVFGHTSKNVITTTTTTISQSIELMLLHSTFPLHSQSKCVRWLAVSVVVVDGSLCWWTTPVLSYCISYDPRTAPTVTFYFIFPISLRFWRVREAFDIKSRHWNTFNQNRMKLSWLKSTTANAYWLKTKVNKVVVITKCNQSKRKPKANSYTRVWCDEFEAPLRRSKYASIMWNFVNGHWTIGQKKRNRTQCHSMRHSAKTPITHKTQVRNSYTKT